MATAAPGRPSFAGKLALKIEFDREEDGRWIAEVPELPGVMAYGESQEEAMRKVQALALRVLADRIERDKSAHESITVACA